MKHLILLLAFLIPAVSGFGQSPTTNPTDPEARDAENLISIYGDTYTNISGINFDPNWGQSGHTQVNPTFDPGTGNPVLAYPNFNYQGTDFGSNAQNAAGMEFLHVDIWVPTGTDRLVKVSPINSGTGASEVLVSVPLTPGSWNSVDIPKSDFTGMTWDNVVQMKFDGQFNGDGSANTSPFDIHVDNVFFWKNAANPASDATLSDLQVEGETVIGFNSTIENYTIELPSGTTTVPQITTATATNANAMVTITQATGIPGDATVDVESEDETATKTYTVSFVEEVAPSVAAPIPPMRDAGDVISIYSDAYADINVGTFSASFDDSDVEFVAIAGDSTLKIDFTNFIGVDFQNDRQDASAMTHFHLDFWTGETDLDGKVFNSKFSQWGGTSGEVSAFELPINTGTSPAIESGTWVSIDVPISDWTNAPQTRDDIAQFLITSNLDEVFVDNIYLYKEGGSTSGELLTNGDFESGDDGSWTGNGFNIQTEGGNSFNFVDVATAGNAFDVNLSQVLPITEGETYQLTFDASTSTGNTRTMLAGIGLNEGSFAANVETVNLTETTQTFTYELTASGFGSANSRVLFDMGAETGIIVIDNVSLVVTEPTVSTEPMVPAPAPPMRDPADVISIYSNAYADINVDTYSASFDDSDVEFIAIEGDSTLKIDFTNFVGVDFQNDRQDASEMTHFHMDFWTSSSDLDGKVFNSKFSQWGGTSGEVSAFELSTNTATNPAIESGTWVSIDVPISQFSNSPQTRDDIAQFLITSNLDVVFVDNIYLYKDNGGPGEFMGLVNGDFESGDDGSWYGNAFNIQTEGGNSFNFANVETAGNSFDVNLSQLVTLEEGQSYELTFEASTGAGNTRDMVVGIGQSESPFMAATQIVNLTETLTEFTVELKATDDGTGNNFGGPASRVLFDMGAATGVVVIDNVSLAIADSSGPGDIPMPMVAAPTPPNRNAEDVISIYSDAYTSIALDTLSASFDDSEIMEFMIEGNTTLGIDFTNFVGIDFQSNKQDASEMTNFHMDFWTSSTDLVGKVFNSKFSQWGGTDGEVSAFELPINTGTDPAIESGVWVSIDVPISDWTNAPQTRDDIAQFLITSNLDVVFVDNIYLYKGMPVSNEGPNDTPDAFTLDQNYPNPFNPSTTIGFSLPQAEQVTIKVYDMLGREVATLLKQQSYSSGSHQITFDATNLSSGIYIYRLQAGSASFIKRMTLIK